MTEKERDVVIPLMMRGFKDCALEAGSSVTGTEEKNKSIKDFQFCSRNSHKFRTSCFCIFIYNLLPIAAAAISG